LDKFCQPYNLNCTPLVVEKESIEYGGCSFHINAKLIQFRSGKITATKIGYFVTFYKRLPCGNIAPYDASDNIDYFIIAAKDNTIYGFFILPKQILIQYDIISVNNRGGKRGFRLYLPSDMTTSKQAIKTQQWQQEYFFTKANNYLFK
jgi:hypothetical protein